MLHTHTEEWSAAGTPMFPSPASDGHQTHACCVSGSQDAKKEEECVIKGRNEFE